LAKKPTSAQQFVIDCMGEGSRLIQDNWPNSTGSAEMPDVASRPVILRSTVKALEHAGLIEVQVSAGNWILWRLTEQGKALARSREEQYPGSYAETD